MALTILILMANPSKPQGLTVGDAFLTVRWITAIVVEILMGVCRFSIKICDKTSLVVDDTCIEERNGLPGPLGGILDGGMK